MPRTYYLQSAPSIVLFLITAGLSWLLLVELQLPRAEAFVGTTTGGRSFVSNDYRIYRSSRPNGASLAAGLRAVVGKDADADVDADGAIADARSDNNNNNNNNNNSGGFFWDFRGHSCYAEIVRPSAEDGRQQPSNNSNKTKKRKPAVILVHGFACSTVYWRQTRDYLAREGYTVHLVDLLGQGKSAKPGRNDGIVYSIDLWAQMVDEYARRHVAPENDNNNNDDGDDDDDDDDDSSVVLVGNSLGSLVALSVATGDCFQQQNINADTNTDGSSGGGGYLTSRVGGLCLFNCGVGLNTKNIVKVSSNPAWLKTILSVVFGVLDVLVFGNKPLLTYVLDQRVDKETLKSALTALYAYGEDKVDDELVDSFLDPVVKDETSSVVEVLSQIYTNDPGRTPMDLHDTYWSKSSSGKGDGGGIPVPIHLIWGDQDVVTPIQGDVGQFYSNLASSPDAPGVSMQVVENAGHVPFDERPECNQGLIEWLEKTNV